MAKKEAEVKMMLGSKGCKRTCNVMRILAKISEIVLIVAAVMCGLAGIVIGAAQQEVDINGAVAEAQKELGNEAIPGDNEALQAFLARPHNEQIAIILAVMAIAAILCVLSSMLAKNTSKLFKNLTHGRTPFSMENVDLLQKIAKWLFIVTIVSDVTGLLGNIVLGDDAASFNISVGTYLYGFVILVLAVVFRHGYELEHNKKK